MNSSDLSLAIPRNIFSGATIPASNRLEFRGVGYCTMYLFAVPTRRLRNAVSSLSVVRGGERERDVTWDGFVEMLITFND